MENVQVTTTETTTHSDVGAGDLSSRVAKVLGDLSGGAQVDALENVKAEPETAEAPAEGGSARGADGKFQKKGAKDGDSAETAATEPAAPDPEAERQTKLARVHELEKQSYAKAAKLTERERSAEARDKSLREREERLTALERSWDDPEGVLEMLEKRVGIEKLNGWILSQADPAKRMEATAKKAASAAEERVAKLEAEIKAREAKLAADARALAERQAFNAAANQITSMAKQYAAEVPLVARLFEKRPQAAVAMADQVARSFQGEEFNHADVLLRMQAALAADAEIFGAQNSAESGNPSTQVASPAAAVKAKTTVSNRDAAERSAIVKPDDEADLSLEERAQRAIERRRLRSVR
jgi:hypothetical protein